MLAFLLGVLAWSPDQVWRATLPDIRAAIEGRLGRMRNLPPDMTMLAALMAAFPDRETRGHSDER